MADGPMRRFKDETIRKLRSDGMTKADAAAEAWERMAAQYPPLGKYQRIRAESPRRDGWGAAAGTTARRHGK